MEHDELREVIFEIEKLHSALTSHELEIARWTKIQTITSIISATFALVTTIVLIEIGWSQSRTGDKQFLFETRKSSPKITARVVSGDSLKSLGIGDPNLDMFKLRFEKNESEVNSVEILRDYAITKTKLNPDGSAGKVYKCIFRTANFANQISNKNTSDEYTYYQSKFHIDSGFSSDVTLLGSVYSI